MYPLPNIKTVFCFLFIGFFFLACNQHQQARSKIDTPQSDSLEDHQITFFQPGDIICRRGFGMISDLIASFASKNGEISHCGVLIRKQQEWVVVHSTSQAFAKKDGLQCTHLYEFVINSRKESIRVYRLKTEDETVRKFVAATDSISELHIPFDADFDLGRSSELYCTELIQMLFDLAGVEFQLDCREFEGRQVLTFHSFADTFTFDSYSWATGQNWKLNIQHPFLISVLFETRVH